MNERGKHTKNSEFGAGRKGLKPDPIHKTRYAIFSFLSPNLISLHRLSLHNAFSLLFTHSGLSGGVHAEPFVLGNDNGHIHFGTYHGKKSQVI